MRCGQTKLKIGSAEEHGLTANPTVEEARPDKLNEGCLNNQIRLKQILTPPQLEELYSPNTHILARWKFDVKIKYSIDQIPIEQTYYPEWEGEHYQIWELP